MELLDLACAVGVAVAAMPAAPIAIPVKSSRRSIKSSRM